MKPYDYITLGDGDFSYSFDLCRFLRVQASLQDFHEHHNEISTDRSEKSISVFCTGIDSMSELRAKYHDIDFTLQKIVSLNGKVPRLKCDKNDKPECLQQATSMNIYLHHCVNAIQLAHPTDLNPIPLLPPDSKFKQVIFNHPHLAVEDATKHARFLAHFFHSAANSWLSHTGGVLHLTLVKGQYERWKCEHAARKNGFVVLHRGPFYPPPPPGHHLDSVMKNGKYTSQEERSAKKVKTKSFSDAKVYQNVDGYKTRFQYRRHQCGKSFASRAEGGSETITFGRKEDHGCYVATCLPWQNFQYNDILSKEQFKCTYCDKSFGDNRALKNHVKCVHNTGMKKASFSCDLCTTTNRVFTSKKALEAHKKAKHGKYIDVKPDWSKDEYPQEAKNDSEFNDSNSNSEVNWRCSICGLEFFSSADRLKHLEDFIPVATTNSRSNSYSCSKCKKEFHDRRAQQQHENFCQT